MSQMYSKNIILNRNSLIRPSFGTDFVFHVKLEEKKVKQSFERFFQLRRYPKEIMFKVKVHIELATVYDSDLLRYHSDFGSVRFKFRRNKKTPSSGQL